MIDIWLCSTYPAKPASDMTQYVEFMLHNNSIDDGNAHTHDYTTHTLYDNILYNRFMLIDLETMMAFNNDRFECSMSKHYNTLKCWKIFTNRYIFDRYKLDYLYDRHPNKVILEILVKIFLLDLIDEVEKFKK